MNALRRNLSDFYHVATDGRRRAFERQRRIQQLAERHELAEAAAARLPRAGDLLAAGGDDGVAVGEELGRRGRADLPGLVDEEQVRRIREHVTSLLAHDPYRPELGRYRAPDAVPSQTHVSHYRDEDIVRVPHLLELANHPRVLAPVAHWLGGRPTLAALRLWWSTPSADGTPEHAEMFHRDVDDLRFVKLFVYLTDVTEDTGPHVFVDGSHLVDRLTEIRRYQDDEVESAFGPQDIQRLVGPAGTAFLENTYGMHRGVPPVAGPRLIFQPLYALRPLIYGPRKPVIDAAAAPAGLDPFVNRVFVRPQ
jgi:hypothetical protein